MAKPKAAAVPLLDLLLVVQRVAALLAESGCAGELEPLQKSGPWRTEIPTVLIERVAEDLMRTGKNRDRYFDETFSKRHGDLRLFDPLQRAVGDRYEALANAVADTALPTYGRAILTDLCNAFNLHGKSADGRRLLAICRIDTKRGLRLVGKRWPTAARR